jgi:hypothetical protein
VPGEGVLLAAEPASAVTKRPRRETVVDDKVSDSYGPCLFTFIDQGAVRLRQTSLEGLLLPRRLSLNLCVARVWRRSLVSVISSTRVILLRFENLSKSILSCEYSPYSVEYVYVRTDMLWYRKTVFIRF